MANKKTTNFEEARSRPRGNAGHGETAVPRNEQGISNRAGDNDEEAGDDDNDDGGDEGPEE